MWRYHPGFRALFEAVRSGWLGEVHLVRGFKIVVGGGLGPVPRQARTLTEFAPVLEATQVMPTECFAVK